MKAAALGLTIVAGVVSAGCRAPPPRPPRPEPDAFPRGYDARSYDLDASLLAADGGLDGSLLLTIVSRRASLADVDLDAVGLDVRAVSEGGSPRQFRVEADHLYVTLEPPATEGTTRSLAIKYRARPSAGMKRFDNHVYTAFHTRRWMPCNFDPRDKATFVLSLSIPPDWSSLGNGVPRPPGTRWALDAPHSAYLFGFVAGRLTQSARPAADGIPTLEVLATERTPPATVTRLLDETPGMIRFFEEKSGVRFPGSRYGVAFVGGDAAQELASLSLLDDDEYARSWAETQTEDWLAVHELAHQWWGNAATCATWGDFWIQEAFAVFMTAAYKEQRWGRPAYEREWQLLRTRYDKARAASGDSALALGPDAPPGQVPRKLIYSKGPLVFFTLRQELGDAPFWSAVREFTGAAIRASARTVDLQRIFERVATRPLPIFARAVHAPGVP